MAEQCSREKKHGTELSPDVGAQHGLILVRRATLGTFRRMPAKWVCRRGEWLTNTHLFPRTTSRNMNKRVS